MGTVFRTNDPTQFDDIDGIIIDEQTPASSITGVDSNVGILVGQFQRGPKELSLPLNSLAELHEVYGRSSYLGNIQLRNKSFGRVRIIRVVAQDALTASFTDNDGVANIEALHAGEYGNNIELTVEAGSVSGFKLIVVDKNPQSVLTTEVYDNVDVENIGNTFANSNLIKFTIIDPFVGPIQPIAATLLQGGSDGSIADTDYEEAIARAEVSQAGNVLFLDENNSTRNQYLRTHVAETQDKMVIIAGDVSTDLAGAIADVENYRDTDGRIIYAWPWVQTTIDGAQQLTNPSAWAASVFTQTAPNVALSFVDNARFLQGVTGLAYETGRNGHISLDAAGIMAFERKQTIGVVIKNAVTTQLLNSQKRVILRRRMADFLQDSIAELLLNYQNDINSKQVRTEVQAAIIAFDTLLVEAGVLPGEQDVNGGGALLVDTETLNTDNSIAQGLFKIAYRRRIFSSMRYIVLVADIGTNVVVTEEEG